VRVGRHPPIARGNEVVDFAHRVTLIVKELTGTVASHPLLELGEVLRIGAHLGER
jgi:hypothetical protein